MTTATIPSRTSRQSYTVCLHDDGTASCTCTAGSFGKACWHAKALKAEAERRAAELDALNAEIDAMGEQIRWQGGCHGCCGQRQSTPEGDGHRPEEVPVRMLAIAL